MSRVRDDGGQAFPQPVTVGPNDDLYPAYPGMTLRDWFAGQALISMSTWSPVVHGGPHGQKAFDLDTDTARRERARWSYAQADAMLAERAK